MCEGSYASRLSMPMPCSYAVLGPAVSVLTASWLQVVPADQCSASRERSAASTATAPHTDIGRQGQASSHLCWRGLHRSLENCSSALWR